MAWGVIETKTFGLVYIKKNKGRSLAYIVQWSIRPNSQADIKAIKQSPKQTMDETLEEWLSTEVAFDGLVTNSIKTPSENYVCIYSITAASNQLNQCKQCCSHMPIHFYLVGFLGSSYALNGIACFSSYQFRMVAGNTKFEQASSI